MWRNDGATLWLNCRHIQCTRLLRYGESQMNQQQHWQAALIDIVARERREMRDEIIAVLKELQQCANYENCERCRGVANCIERILEIELI